MKTRALMLTPKQVAERHSVDVDNVLAWIRSGELPAINVGANETVARDTGSTLSIWLHSSIDAKCGRKLLRCTNRRPRSQPRDVIEFF